MTKTIRAIIKETVLPPRSPDEMRFWDKHVKNVQVTDYPDAASQQFTPNTIKVPRLADYSDDQDVNADLEIDDTDQDDTYPDSDPDDYEDDDEEAYESVDPENFSDDIVDTTVDNQKDYRGLKDDDDDDYDPSDDYNPDNDVAEEEMTDAQKKKREEIVKSMKKKMSDFKDKYGDRAKDVMYATATKQAMSEERHAKVGDTIHYKVGKETRKGVVRSAASSTPRKGNEYSVHGEIGFVPGHTIVKVEPKDKLRKGVQKVKSFFGKEEIQHQNDTKLMTEENFSKGKLKLHNGKSINISDDDAKAMNALVSKLNDNNRKKMMDNALSDEKGFADILKFAKETTS